MTTNCASPCLSSTGAMAASRGSASSGNMVDSTNVFGKQFCLSVSGFGCWSGILINWRSAGPVNCYGRIEADFCNIVFIGYVTDIARTAYVDGMKGSVIYSKIVVGSSQM